MRNAQANTQVASDKRWVNLMGEIKATRQDLKTLAPRPDRKDKTGPLSVKDNARAANDDGAAMAGLLIGSFLGMHFGPVAGHAMTLVDVYDAYQHDRQNSKAAAEAETGESNRNIELGQKGAIFGAFNTGARAAGRSPEDRAWDAYFDDLGQRRITEQSLAALNRQAAQLERQYLRRMQKLAL